MFILCCYLWIYLLLKLNTFIYLNLGLSKKKSFLFIWCKIKKNYLLNSLFEAINILILNNLIIFSFSSDLCFYWIFYQRIPMIFIDWHHLWFHFFIRHRIFFLGLIIFVIFHAFDLIKESFLKLDLHKVVFFQS